MGDRYYKLLGVDKSVDNDGLKKAYKKAALKWHPDRNGGSEEASKKFKEISEAFEVLSDSNKRAVYDQFGEEGLKSGGPVPGQGNGPSGFSSAGGGFPGGTFTFTSSGPGGFGGSSGFSPSDPQKIFESMFGGGGASIFSGMGGMGGMGGGGSRRRTHSMFEDEDDAMDGSFGFGSGMPGGVPRGFASQAHPRRSASPSSPHPNSEISRPLKVSLEELYNGGTKHLKIGRRLLNGSTEDKILDIQIHPGWKSGTKIRFARAGNEQPTGEAQDLVFVVEEKPHDRFTREGNDLITRVPIPLLEALTGAQGKKVVEMLDGRKLQVPVPAGVVKPNQETIIHGQGMPIRKDGSVTSKGDLVVKWDVIFPDKITPAQQEGLKKVLG